MTTEQNLSALSEYDFVLVLDASGSMSKEDMKGRSRWAYMQETAAAFARDVGKLDSDGIDVVVFNGANIQSFPGIDANRVEAIFNENRPTSSTPLAGALQAALKLAGKSAKKDFIIVFTDGEPDDKEAAAKVIREASNQLASDEDLTFLFVQVGFDPYATNYLRGLDDNLKGAKFDIVDVKTIDEAEKFASTADLVIAAIND